MGKKMLLILVSLFLGWQSWVLISKITDIEITSWGWNVFVAWAINMVITGIFAFSGFALPTQRLLPVAYYRISKPKQLLQCYDLLRVAVFRRLLLATLWRDQAQRNRYFNGKKSGLAHLEEQSQKSEFGHLIPFILLLGVSIYFVTYGHWQLGLSTALINFIGNFYPIVLQRHHRLRLQQLRLRLEH